MDFMSVGSSEIVMILLVALLVVGPNKVVELSRTLGRMMRSIKKASSDLTTAVSRELELEEREKTSQSSPEEQDQSPDSRALPH